MRQQIKLIDHTHSGRVRSHEHTSYLPLAAILLLVGFCLLSYSVAAWERPGPAAESIGLQGIVPGKPPAEAPTITTPMTNQRFTQTPVTVSGACPLNVLIELFKNDIFAGSTPCTNDGTYSLEIDLMTGQNTLIARAYDALNQAGPDSNVVTVQYDDARLNAAGLTPLNFGGNQLIVNTDAVFRGSFPDKEMSVPIDILGGRAPYAINVQWGDTTNKVVSRPDNASFRVAHAYKKAGTYQLAIQATDADGRVAFLTVASIVNGQPDPIVAQVETEKTTLRSLLVLWPLYASTFAVVVSFWLGEWREKRSLQRQGLLAA